MPQPVNNRHGEQWDVCGRCGLFFPMSQLVKQLGLLVCTRTCFDNLEVQRRSVVIEEVLGPSSEEEGMDLRQIDRGFFEGVDDVER